MLIVFGGLPGVGKTSVARKLAPLIAALHLRIDTIEDVLRGWRPIDDLGYRIAYALAEENLRLGLTVIADSVNPIELTREAWRAVGERAGVRVIEVEFVCSDNAEHRRRVESRDRPTWQEVVDREYDAWARERIVVETAGRDVETCVRELRATIAV